MKKIIAGILSVAILLSCAACSGGSKGSSEAASSENETASVADHSVDILAYAGEGTIPEMDVSLGTYIGTVKEMYNYSANSNGEGSTEVTESDLDEFHNDVEKYDMVIYDSYTEVKVDIGEAYLFYKTKYEGKGMSKIVCFKDAFDFKIGITMPDDVKSAISATPDIEEDVTKVDFLPGTPANFSRVVYNVNDYTLEFYFADDFLSCIVLTDNRYWVQ